MLYTNPLLHSPHRILCGPGVDCSLIEYEGPHEYAPVKVILMTVSEMPNVG